MKNIVLIGGGDQAHYTIDIIHKQGKYNIVGIIDAQEKLNTEKFGYKIIGRQENIKHLIPIFDIHGAVISIGDNWTRYYVASQVKN